ncbi:hypothetical protein [Brevibacterium sp. UCMA 11752]|uniref:hypothetical protein n=1 Tax=Brevibacterium sp. UCMA 11752 TaxID=2745946 RepID=UPI001F1C3494|nr:hypothetical protein [Brevibacterium sp. UCMA 11752]MCF2587774.1 hypothetical protein [Brevibacterium sp. UCMA 11752]
MTSDQLGIIPEGDDRGLARNPTSSGRNQNATKVKTKRVSQNGSREGDLWKEIPIWIRATLVLVGLTLLFLTVIALTYAIYVIFNIPFPSLLDHIGSNNGQGTAVVGDTFGGLLAPVLTAGALGATLWFSLAQVNDARSATRKQIESSEEDSRLRREEDEKARKDEMSAVNRQLDQASRQFNEEMTRAANDAEFSKAELINAWVADARRSDQVNATLHGVVITNRCGSLVHNFDLMISRTNDHFQNEHDVVAVEGGGEVSDSLQSSSPAAGSRRRARAVENGGPIHDSGQNRESAIPPGDWFVPFFPNDSGVLKFSWQKILPISVKDGRSVVSIPSAESHAYDLRLEPHTRLKSGTGANSGDPDLPFYVIARQAFYLYGQLWERDEHGKLYKGVVPGDRNPCSWDESELMGNAASFKPVVRAEWAGNRLGKVWEIVSLTLKELLSDKSWEHLMASPDSALVPADGGAISRIYRVTFKSASSSAIRLYMNEDVYLELSASNSRSGSQFGGEGKQLLYPRVELGGLPSLEGYKIEVTRYGSRGFPDIRNGVPTRKSVAANTAIRHAAVSVIRSLTGEGSVSTQGLFDDQALLRDYRYWVENRAVWFAALQAMVNMANDIVDDQARTASRE